MFNINFKIMLKIGRAVFHADLLSDEEKKQEGIEYTYNWNLVTDEGHLSRRGEAPKQKTVDSPKIIDTKKP